MEYDLKTSAMRLANFRGFYLRIARPIVFIGFAVMFLLSFTTVWFNHVTAKAEAHATLKDIIYRNTK